MSLRLDWIDAKASRYACERWHYSRTIPTGKSAKLGVWESSGFIGVVVFSLGNKGLGSPFGIERHGTVELSRVALARHRAPVSKIVAIAVRLFTRSAPQIEIIVSYADPSEGHHGGIYQAMGWVYTGTASMTPSWVTKSGRYVHNRSASQSGVIRRYGGVKPCWRHDQLTRIDKPKKHRYVLPLSTRARHGAEKLRQPYPKRDSAPEA